MASLTKSPSISFWQRIKQILFILLICILVTGSILGYVWYKNIIKVNEQAQITLPKAAHFNDIKTKIEKEQNSCRTFISNGRGDFGSFEYCRRFLNWSKTLPL